MPDAGAKKRDSKSNPGRSLGLVTITPRHSTAASVRKSGLIPDNSTGLATSTR